ncbi:olfactory receptor 11H6-like [Microcaecilia unicolor]|uniref:Olfactory receptor n=1 Tax=Microcaecilia unicolor TaxID=1415580 RepID=A0A6P7WGK7_9AMPH|nr:olfactory receptor 11H6-like [Microcaecilia unicolor]
MQGGNQTGVKEFILRGFSINGVGQSVIFTLVLAIFILTLIGNITIIMLVWSNPTLHKPMYMFLANLSFVEIWYTTSTVPKIMAGFLMKNNYISFTGCFLQYFFFFSLGTTECFLLAVMGYDRYLAICHPLRYNVLMSSRKCLCLGASCWIAGFVWSVVPVSLISQLPFCRENEIDHILCDTGPLLEIVCVRDYMSEVASSISSSSMLLFTFSSIFISYAFIIQTIVRIPSSSGRHKAFSTCASHLTVVIVMFACTMYMYIRPSGKHPLQYDKLLATIYTIVTPFLNPIIYSLRNKEFMKVVKKVMGY